MEFETGYILCAEEGIYGKELPGVLNALSEIGCIYSEQENICIRVEPTKQSGIYLVRPLKCKSCAFHPGCGLPPSVRRRSAWPTKNLLSFGKRVLRKLYRCLRKVCGMLSIPLPSVTGTCRAYGNIPYRSYGTNGRHFSGGLS